MKIKTGKEEKMRKTTTIILGLMVITTLSTVYAADPCGSSISCGFVGDDNTDRSFEEGTTEGYTIEMNYSASDCGRGFATIGIQSDYTGTWTYLPTTGWSGTNVTTSGFTNPGQAFGFAGQAYATRLVYSIDLGDYDLRGTCKFSTSSTTRNTPNTPTHTVIEETTPPTVTLINPDNGLIDVDGSIVIQSNCTDNYAGVSQLELWHNATGTWHLNVTNTSAEYTEGDLWTVNLAGLEDGITFNWTVNCSDERGNYGNGGNRWITINESASPVVDITAPLYSEEFDGNVTIEGTCTTDLGVSSLELWHNASGTWHLNLTNSSYSSGDLWSVRVENVSDEVGWNFSLNCTDDYDNTDEMTQSMSTNYNSSPITVDMCSTYSTCNGTSDADGNFSIVCGAGAGLPINYIEFWSDVNGTWENLYNTTNDWVYFFSGEEPPTQYGHIQAYDASGNGAEQMKFDASEVTSDTLCLSPEGSGWSFNNITISRVDDQTWNPLTINTGDFNSQTLTNTTNSTGAYVVGQYTDYWCYDVADIVQEMQDQSDGYLTVRLEHPENRVTTATSVGGYFYYYGIFGGGGSTNRFCYLYGTCADYTLPTFGTLYGFGERFKYIEVDFYDIPSGSFNYSCKAGDFDSPENSAWGVNNTYIVEGESDMCNLETINSTGTIDLSQYCTLNNNGVISNQVTFYNAGNVTFNASINFTGGWNNITQYFKAYVTENGHVKVG